MTVWDAMLAIYEKYGYYKDDVRSITLKGLAGLDKIQKILETLRKDPPQKIGTLEVLKIRDYKKGILTDLATGETTDTGLPESNVLYYDLTDDAWVCVRPSGTEPKVKFYYGVKGNSLEDAEARSKELGEKIMELIESMT
jgi:phosphoglucomutase